MKLRKGQWIVKTLYEPCCLCGAPSTDRIRHEEDGKTVKTRYYCQPCVEREWQRLADGAAPRCEDCGHTPCDCGQMRAAHELLYGDEEEAAYLSDDDTFDEPHGEECCCEDCLQDYPERDALYNGCQFYGLPEDEREESNGGDSMTSDATSNQASGPQTPISDEQLAQIRARVTGDDDLALYWNGMGGALEQAEDDRAALLAEVERQRADCAGCEQVTQAEQESREAAQQIAGDALRKLNECKCRVDDLRVDVERLKAREAQMREIVAAVAEANHRRIGCGQAIIDYLDIPGVNGFQRQARALLA